MKTEKDKMIAGEFYDPADNLLIKERLEARLMCKRFNESNPSAVAERTATLKSLISEQGENLKIEPPFFCDYGYNIKAGANVYMNFNCIILDICPVYIGDNTMMGPAVQIYAAMHPMDTARRNSGKEFGKPVSIGKNVWVGGNAIILPGVTIGDGCVIGAGSVVTRNIPANSFAAGNPARVIKEIDNTKAL